MFDLETNFRITLLQKKIKGILTKEQYLSFVDVLPTNFDIGIYAENKAMAKNEEFLHIKRVLHRLIKDLSLFSIDDLNQREIEDSFKMSKESLNFLYFFDVDIDRIKKDYFSYEWKQGRQAKYKKKREIHNWLAMILNFRNQMNGKNTINTKKIKI